jgi:hypothetical protein
MASKDDTFFKNVYTNWRAYFKTIIVLSSVFVKTAFYIFSSFTTQLFTSKIEPENMHSHHTFILVALT